MLAIRAAKAATVAAIALFATLVTFGNVTDYDTNFAFVRQAITALLCWIGAAQLAHRLRANSASFNRAKRFAIAGLTLGFLLWQGGFMSIGGEWFGMWQSKEWNGVPSAFRFAITIIAVLIFVAMPDQELERRAQP